MTFEYKIYCSIDTKRDFKIKLLGKLLHLLITLEDGFIIICIMYHVLCMRDTLLVTIVYKGCFHSYNYV